MNRVYWIVISLSGGMRGMLPKEYFCREEVEQFFAILGVKEVHLELGMKTLLADEIAEDGKKM